MGLINETYESFYENGQSLEANSYQFTTMDNIIAAFMIAYVGENKLISKINRTDIQFHAMRAIQELSYDVFRSIKSQEIKVPPTLSIMLPQDYVNYVKLARVDSNGIERILYPTGKTSNPTPVAQSADGTYLFDAAGSLGTVANEAGDAGINNVLQNSKTLNNFNSQTANYDVYSDDTSEIEIDNKGRRYGLDPQYSQSNGTFFIDKLGRIHFSSALVGETVTLKYISDGLGTDDEMVVHKFCEEACYKHIAYAVLSTRSNIPEYIVNRFKKEKFAETRKAKIRLSNIKIEEFTQVVKGMGKQIK